MRYSHKIISLVLLTTISGCAAEGNLNNPFASQEPVATSNFYHSEFEDIPIPNELSESRGDTFITFAPSGTKCGIQRFSGRVELVSLMNTMRRFMADNGWVLRSLLRAKESVLLFEKGNRLATIQFSDGVMTTDMRVFVSSRIEGDTAAAMETSSFQGGMSNEQSAAPVGDDANVPLSSPVATEESLPQ